MILLLACPGRAQESERGLLSPSQAKPAHAEPGGSFSLMVRSATALTPPPGIQEPRAHRAFGVWLCAAGISLGAPARICFPLPVDDLRPLASHSLEYRVDVKLPYWVAPGSYELGVRFPGGTQSVVDGLRVGQAANGACQPHIERVSQPGPGVRVTSSCDLRLRVHLGGPEGLIDAPAVETFPLPTESGEFGEGVVVLIGVTAQQPLVLIPGPAAGSAVTDSDASARAASLFVSSPGAGGRADAVSLEVRGAPAKARIFWRLSPWQSAIGARTTARFGGTSRAGTATAAVIGPDASVRILRSDLTRPGHAGGCQVGNARGGWPVAGLLFLALSRKLGPRRRPRAAPGGGGGRE